MTIQNPVRLNSDVNAVLKVERPFYEQLQFNRDLNYCKSNENKRNVCSKWIISVRPMNIFLSIFPIISWLPGYKIKHDLVSDLIAGCTVAIMHIPQGRTIPIKSL